MKKWFVIGGIVAVVALVGTLAWSAVSFAQGPQGGFIFGPGGFGRGGGFGQFDGDGPGRGAFDEPGFGRGGFGGAIDQEALLAQELGITVEELQAARERAQRAAVQQGVDQGLITQEEADQMLSRLNLRTYLDPEALTAEALGITQVELEQARADGKPLIVLAYELGIDQATLRTNMQTARENALQKAVADGVITQEQADQLQNGPGFGEPHGRGRAGGGPGFGGPGGFGGRR